MQASDQRFPRRRAPAPAGPPTGRSPAPRFPPEALAFLRALTRHNDREWFKARRAAYERCLRDPMVAVIERLADDFATFAPELVASPRVSLYRIYRDTRFSADKSPLKTHVAAVFPCRGLGKHEGAGLYLEIAPRRVLTAGGLYAPGREHLVRVREHIAANLRRLRSIVEAPAFRRRFGGIDGRSLQRVPRGFPPDHPAAPYLKLQQFLVYREHPASLATSPRFYATTLEVFRAMAPLIRFLNEPLLAAPPRDPLL